MILSALLSPLTFYTTSLLVPPSLHTKTLLGHQVAREHRRPAFPSSTPLGFRRIVEACWDPNPAARSEPPSLLNVMGWLRIQVAADEVNCNNLLCLPES